MTARWIAFEGWEGTGKSTQTELLGDRLGAVVTREPGGTPLGLGIRDLLLHTEMPITARTEALLFAADRAQHVSEVVEPALASGRDVVSDRSLYSSLAYQGGGGGLDVEELRSIMSWALGDRLPDLVILLEAPYELARDRLGRPDRIEARSAEYHQAVIDTFERLADDDPHRWCRVSATGPIDEVALRVNDVVESWTARHG